MLIQNKKIIIKIIINHIEETYIIAFIYNIYLMNYIKYILFIK